MCCMANIYWSSFVHWNNIQSGRTRMHNLSISNCSEDDNEVNMFYSGSKCTVFTKYKHTVYPSRSLLSSGVS